MVRKPQAHAAMMLEPELVTGDAVIDQMLQFIVKEHWGKSGDEFFSSLVARLAELLGTAHACCDTVVFDQPKTVETIAFYSNGKMAENIRYHLRGTPCENVVGLSPQCYVENIQALFPEDAFLCEIGAESYVGVPLWRSDGAPLGLLAVIDDKPLTDPELATRLLSIVAMRASAELERWYTEKALKDSEHRFRDFADISSDWFWETDADLRFSWFSDRFEAISGVAPEKLLGRTREEVGAPGADPDAYVKLLSEMHTRRPFRNFRHHRILPSGDTVYLEISGTPAFDENGDFVGYRGTGRDITDFKRIELELLESRDQATRANRAKTEFLASMSHEFRTPLNAIRGMSEALLSMPTLRDDSEKLSEYLADILSSSVHLTGLIDDVLDLSKIEAGRAEVDVEIFDPAPKIAEAVRLAGQSARDRGTRIQTELKSNAAEIAADPRSFQQVLLNLLSNGVRHGNQGGTVRVETDIVTGHGESRFLVSVQDDGPGIPEIVRNNLGQLFIQAGSSMISGDNKGTGLGLAIVARLVALNGAILEIDETWETGARIDTFWPLAALARSPGEE